MVIYDSVADCVNECGLSQFATEPTRIGKSGCENKLDHVSFSNRAVAIF